MYLAKQPLLLFAIGGNWKTCHERKVDIFKTLNPVVYVLTVKALVC